MDSQNAPASATHRWLFLAAALHGLVFQILLPPWMGEDEPWHLEYARDLTLATEESRSTPPAPEELAAATPSQRRIQERTRAGLQDVQETQVAIVESMQRENFWRRVDFAGWGPGAQDLDRFTLGHTEAHQPPLYYRLCSVLLSTTGTTEVESQLYLLRGFSFLCYLAVLGFALALARQATRDPWIPIVAVLLVAWLPMHARQSAVVSNDVLVKVFTAAVLWLLASHMVRPKRPFARARTLAIPLCVVLAMATKQTAVGLAGPLCLVLIWSSVRRRGALIGTLQGLAMIAVTVGAAAYLQWGSAEKRDTLDGLGVPTNAVELREHLAWILSPNFWREGAETLAGSFNWYSRDLPPFMVGSLLAVLAIGLIGSLLALKRDDVHYHRPVLILCWLAVGTQVLAMLARGFSAGRFLFPVLPALMTLVAVGLISPLSPRQRPRAVLAAAATLVVYDGFALWNGLFKHQYLIWGS